MDKTSQDRNGASSSRQHGDDDRRSSKLTGSGAVARARKYLNDFTGNDAESVSGVAHGPDGGWDVRLEVVELERIPRSTDILATYAVELDRRGELMRCERVGRYYRNQAGGE